MPVRARVEVREPFAVDLLQAADRSGELALPDPARPLDPDPPPQLRMAVERDEVREVVTPSPGASGEGAARMDHRRRDPECAEQEVDRLRHARLAGAGVRVLGRPRDQPRADRPQRVELMGGQEAPAACPSRRFRKERVEPPCGQECEQSYRAASSNEGPAADAVAHSADATPRAAAPLPDAAGSPRARTP